MATATAEDVLRGIRRDPVGFCREVLDFEPWSKQRAVMESVRDNKRTAVRSAHGTGKTSIAARIVLWFLAAFPRSRVISTAPIWAQVREQLWREIAVAYRQAEGFIDGQLTDTRLELAPDWFAIGLSTDRPERFAGFHAEHLLLVVDEASGVEEGIFEVSETFLTSPGSKVLLIGNPVSLSGQFHRAFHAERALWKTLSISALDTPAFTGEHVSEETLRRLVSREWVADAERKWGADSPLYHVRVLGEFPSTSDDTVVSLADVEAAQKRSLPPADPAVVACDVARFGSDETVIAVRRGQHVRIAKTFGGQDTMKTTGAVLRIARDLAGKTRTAPTIVVDDAGVGGGVTDRLREVAEFPVVPFLGAATAIQRRDYPNRRSEAWFALAELLPEVDLDDDELLAGDLLAPRYSLDSQGRRVVERKEESKKRLRRSPDRGDAVVMAFAVTGDVPSASVGWDPADRALGLAGSGKLDDSISYERVW